MLVTEDKKSPVDTELHGEGDQGQFRMGSLPMVDNGATCCAHDDWETILAISFIYCACSNTLTPLVRAPTGPDPGSSHSHNTRGPHNCAYRSCNDAETQLLRLMNVQDHLSLAEYRRHKINRTVARVSHLKNKTSSKRKKKEKTSFHKSPSQDAKMVGWRRTYPSKAPVGPLREIKSS